MARPRALLCDIDGVLTVSWRALPGAVEALARLRSSGPPVLFVTNTTSATRADVADRLGAAGFGVDPDDVFTAPRAAAAYLTDHHPGARCLLLNHGDVEEDLAGVDLTTGADADVVLTGGAGHEVGYELLNTAFHALSAGATLVAMHRNLDWQTEDGLQLDMGAFIVGLEKAAGIAAVVTGKPSPAFFGAVLAGRGVAPDEALMVGDDIDADVLGAQAAGITGVLVRTGKFREETLARSSGRPDHVIDSVGDLPDLIDTLA